MSTIFSRKDDTSLARALVVAYNELQAATVVVSTDGYHRDISGVDTSTDYTNPSSISLQVTAATAVDLATTVAMALNIKGVLHVHFADDSAHLIADTVNTAFDGYGIDTTSNTTKLNSAIVLLNLEKADFNAHLTQSGVHLKSDTANSVATADASDLTSAEALANAMKTKINAHILSGPTVGRIKLVGS